MATVQEEAENAIKRLSSCTIALGEENGAIKDDKMLKMAIFSLQKYLKEPDFALEFLDRGGLESLCDIIRQTTGNTLAYALNSFTCLMEHDIDWEDFPDDFVIDVAHIVVNETLPTICRSATAILTKIVSTDPSLYPNTTPDHLGYPAIHKAMESENQLLPTLAHLLLSQDLGLCLNSLKLLSAMTRFSSNDLPENQSWFLDKVEELNIRKRVVRLMKESPSDELKEQLLVFQSSLIYSMSQRRRVPVSIHNQRHAEMLNDIWNAAKLVEDRQAKRDWMKIGFSKSDKPENEFAKTGEIGLEMMHAFVIDHSDKFPKIVLEGCPFARSSVEVTNLLCRYWNINSEYVAAELEPLLLMFSRMYGSTLNCFYRVFNEMEASESLDFPKVSAFVRSQLRFVLKGEGGKDIFEFDRLMRSTPYTSIRDRRLQEIEWDDDLLARDAIGNLRKKLNGQAYDFIKQQRFRTLLKGAWFPCPINSQWTTTSVTNTSGISITSSNVNVSTPSPPLSSMISMSGKRWRYYKLSPSKKILHFGEFSERSPAEIENYDNLPHKIEMESITDIRPIQKVSTYMPMTSPSATAINQPSASHPSTPIDGQMLSFGLFADKQTPVAEFICSTATQSSEWKDGFGMLLDKGIMSRDTAKYKRDLAEIGIKIKLLQITGDRIDIPQTAPPVLSIPPHLGSGYFYDQV